MDANDQLLKQLKIKNNTRSERGVRVIYCDTIPCYKSVLSGYGQPAYHRQGTITEYRLLTCIEPKTIFVLRLGRMSNTEY